MEYFSLAVRQAYASRHNGDQLSAFPEPLGTILMWCSIKPLGTISMWCSRTPRYNIDVMFSNPSVQYWCDFRWFEGAYIWAPLIVVIITHGSFCYIYILLHFYFSSKIKPKNMTKILGRNFSQKCTNSNHSHCNPSKLTHFHPTFRNQKELYWLKPLYQM